MSRRTDKCFKHTQVHQRPGLWMMTRRILIGLGLLSIAFFQVIHNRVDSIQYSLWFPVPSAQFDM